MSMCFPQIDLGKSCGMVFQLLKEAISIAEQTQRRVTFEFNGVIVKVDSTTQFNDADMVLHAVQNGTKHLDLRRG